MHITLSLLFLTFIIYFDYIIFMNCLLSLGYDNGCAKGINVMREELYPRDNSE